MWIIIIIAILVFVYVIYRLSHPIRGGNVDGTKSVQEYHRWLAIQDMKRMMNSREASNILERWLMTCANSGGSGDVILKHDEKADQRYLVECGEKNIPPRLVELHRIRSRYETTPARGPGGSPKFSEGTITWGKFRREVPAARLAKMLELGSEDAILTCALRYACLNEGGQQWGVPPSLYESHDGLEAFASPWNSRNMMLGRKFCSLFPDVDAVFGSQGNFFEFSPPADVLIICNPPFINEILAAAARKCIVLPNPCIFVGPEWPDAEFSKLLSAWKSEAKKSSYYDIHDREVKIVTRIWTKIIS